MSEKSNPRGQGRINWRQEALRSLFEIAVAWSGVPVPTEGTVAAVIEAEHLEYVGEVIDDLAKIVHDFYLDDAVKPDL